MKMNRSAAYIVELILRGILSGSVLAVFIGYIYGDGFISLATGLGICLASELIFGFIRSRTTRFGMFFVWHILTILPSILLMPEISGKFIVAVMQIVLMADSVAQLKKPFSEGNRLHFGMASIFLFASYVASYMEFKNLEYSCFVLTAVFMALYFIREGFFNTQQFIEHNDNSKDTPVRDIRIRSYALVCGFGIGVGIFMVAFRYMGGEFIIKHLGSAFYAVVSAFARWIIYQLQGSYVDNPETMQDTDMFGFVKDAFKERNIPPFIEIIEKVIRYFFIAAIIIGAVALVVWLVIKFYSIFGADRRNNKKDQSGEFILPFSSDKISKVVKEKKTKGSPVSNKARRYYKKYVQRKMLKKDDSLLSKTPYEISSHLGLAMVEGDEEIRRIYEKARYSERECTKEEIKLLKEYAKGRVKQ